MPVSRPYDPANYATVPDVLALAAKLEDRIESLEYALHCTASFLSVGKFDKTNVDVLTRIVEHALQKSDLK